MSRLKELRIEQKLKQEQVATAAGIERAYYSMLETGKRTPSIKTAKALANVLGCSIDELLRDPEEEAAAVAA